MLELLKSKGYEGSDNLEEIIEWLETKNIYLGFSPSFDGNTSELLGYSITWCFGSSPTYQIDTALHASYRDALTNVVYLLKDYIW